MDLDDVLFPFEVFLLAEGALADEYSDFGGLRVLRFEHMHFRFDLNLLYGNYCIISV